MTDHQRLFLLQAHSDFAVFELLRAHCHDDDLPACHALHYLQMATELLGKAYAWRHGPPRQTHRAFVRFLRSLTTNREAQKSLGFEGRNERWEQSIRKSVPFAKRVEDLAPALAGNGPNAEYPWPPADPAIAPADHNFALWNDVDGTPAGRQFLHLVTRLFVIADAFL
ncbi:MAG TPA: hypothetical protein VFI31_00490 [Pirellulales bacterium]|nr:hypothetical protein [Pirellulales bacterium]